MRGVHARLFITLADSHAYANGVIALTYRPSSAAGG
jgi:hypothetical protein